MKTLWLIENNDTAVKRISTAVKDMFRVCVWSWPIGLPDSIEEVKSDKEHPLAVIVLSPDYVACSKMIKRTKHAVTTLKQYAPVGVGLFLWTKHLSTFQGNKLFMKELEMMSCPIIDKFGFSEEETIREILKPFV